MRARGGSRRCSAHRCRVTAWADRGWAFLRGRFPPLPTLPILAHCRGAGRTRAGFGVLVGVQTSARGHFVRASARCPPCPLRPTAAPPAMQSSARRWQWAVRRAGAIGMHLLRVGMGPATPTGRPPPRPACGSDNKISGGENCGLTSCKTGTVPYSSLTRSHFTHTSYSTPLTLLVPHTSDSRALGGCVTAHRCASRLVFCSCIPSCTACSCSPQPCTHPHPHRHPTPHPTLPSYLLPLSLLS